MVILACVLGVWRVRVESTRLGSTTSLWGESCRGMNWTFLLVIPVAGKYVVEVYAR